jgi:nucleotide-binding universal stress UspA family protein
MATPASGPTASRTAGAGIFDHVLVGIDETPESLVAAAQARVLRAPGGRLELLAVAETYLAAHAGAAAPIADDDLYAGTQLELERARELVQPDAARLVSGRLVDVLCGECTRGSATLVAVGVRAHGRIGTLMFGGHDIEVLHEAPCSVLIARPGWGPAKPGRIVVAVGTAPEAHAAEAVARPLAARLGRELVPLVGLGDDLDLALLRAEREDAVLHPGGIADAIGSMSAAGDLVVVGRGRKGRHGRGAGVAERVAYAARCSVLVVRQPDA